ncbi:amidohydrolase family protein [Cohnella terricola]|uniref:Amidohydrolase family protein n=1 Tax=Cohnella terricola TaxID=1289167 RepID=A0A559JQ71_9BACL|nr:amidohydrolase family protein [Cohnella terricola]TVY02035.1 amidohydrolase family protein [Cohnella terricola]
MSRKKHCYLVIAVLTVIAVCLFGCSTYKQTVVKPWTEYVPKNETALITDIRKNKDPNKELYEVYDELTVIDIHNHDAANPSAIYKWGMYGIDRIVLFGNISEPSAQETDRIAWEQYRNESSHVYPSFAGFPIYEEEGVTIVQQNLENGYLNIGEVAAASSFSPVVSKVEWKAEHPNDGNFPKIYDLAAKYRVPILLHIDPPNGEPIAHLEEALDEHPDTVIIFGHANAYNPPSNIEILLAKHPNLYIDFFAGFTAYNGESTNKLEDFVPLIEKYPDRFMLSTDSGYGLTTEEAAKALYELIDLLSPETAPKVAYQNYERLIELQPPTDTQIRTIKSLSARAGKYETYHLNKRMANELIFELTKMTEK